MALNFPLNPADGDTYENYVYDATEGVWNANPQQLASRFITSATQPSTPSNGDGWLDTNTGKTYIYYNDGSSAQWIESGNPVIGFVDPYDQDSTSTGYLSLPKGTTAQRPITPSNGDIRFNTELGEPEWYSAANDQWVLFRDGPTFDVEYLIVAGGGGATAGSAGGSSGGAGGGEVLASTSVLFRTDYTVTVGAGGSGGTTTATNGSPSFFNTEEVSPGLFSEYPTGGFATSGGASGSGNAGGSPVSNSAGGGGGDSSVGQTAPSSTSAGDGGAGTSSSISGASVGYGGGGGGAIRNSTDVGTGIDGGGDGGYYISNEDQPLPTAGATNRGGGGGGGGAGNGVGANGGSGVVIIKYPSTITATPSVGLESITNTVGNYKVTQFTSGTGTVTFL